jgi:DNA repair exonuclease SbcCD ATPase subunit
MIFGQNLTDSGADSNGSGKSGLMEGITVAMTGKTCRDVNREEFINDDADDCYVEFSLQNEVSDIKELTIKRWIHRKKSARIELWENGELNTQMTSVNEANSRIFELLGITREDLLHFFIIGQNTNHSFLSAGDTEQKEIIARLTNADVIQEKIEHLKNRKKESVAVAEELKSSYDKFVNYIELTEQSIKDEKANGQNEVKEKIKECKDLIKDSKQLVDEYDKKASQKEREIKEREKLIKLNKSKIVDTSEIENDLDSKKAKLRTRLSAIDEGDDFISKMNRILSGKTTCPKCSHEWSEGEDWNLEEIPDAIEDTKKINKKSSKLVATYRKQIEDLKKQLGVNDEIDERMSDLNDEIDDLKYDIKSLKRKKSSCEENIKDAEKKQDRLVKEMNSNSKIESYKVKLNEYKEKRDKELVKLEKAFKESADYDFWIHHFSRKGFMTYLTNQSIKTIEGVTNSHLKRFNTD